MRKKFCFELKCGQCRSEIRLNVLCSKCRQCRSEIRLNVLCRLNLIYTLHKSPVCRQQRISFREIIDKVAESAEQDQIARMCSLILLYTFRKKKKTLTQMTGKRLKADLYHKGQVNPFPNDTF